MSASCFFFFNDTATTEIYTFPYTTLFRSTEVWRDTIAFGGDAQLAVARIVVRPSDLPVGEGQLVLRTVASAGRSEEHTSELQSRLHLVCRLLLEKKKTQAERMSERELLET